MQDEIVKGIRENFEWPKLEVTGIVWYDQKNTATGKSGPHIWLIDDWGEDPVRKNFTNGSFLYHIEGHDERIYHNPCGPALSYKDGTPLWYIKGTPLTDAEILVVKSILNELKLAPLYINHPVFQYTARWVLKNKS